MKSFILACILLSMITPVRSEPVSANFSLASTSTLSTSDRILAQAFKSKTSGFMVKFFGTVIRKLPDDTVGSRHQKFIVRLNSGQTLLIAHNIDLAPRVAHLKTSNTVSIYGEYIWNAEGGIVHQTHHNPGGTIGGGWIRHKGVVYR
jgi:cytosine/uracil/thiamine/allantoin permease